jgi:hypothetical protein
VAVFPATNGNSKFERESGAKIAAAKTDEDLNPTKRNEGGRSSILTFGASPRCRSKQTIVDIELHCTI